MQGSLRTLNRSQAGGFSARRHRGPARAGLLARPAPPGNRARSVTLLRTAAPEASANISQWSLDDIDISNLDIEDPRAPVERFGNMSSVITTTPEKTLADLLPVLDKMSGLPVVDAASGKVVGVLSRKDVVRAKRAGLDVSTEMVAAHMGKPAITITRDAPIGEAAALMLASNIRRLPIVDAGMLPIGLLSRTDVFKAGSLVARISVNDCPPAPAPPPELVVGASSPLTPWRIKYLYDGDCAMCQSLMNVLSRQDGGRGIIKFVNIADPAYAPQDNANVAYEEAMETIHAIRPDGSMALGTDALRELFGAVGLGWAAALIDNPITSKVVDWVYDLLSKYRLPIGKGMDFVVAAKRIKMSSEGVQTCGDLDGDGCQVEW